jgi:rubrerythrin
MRQPQNAKRGRGRGRRGNMSGNHNHVPNRNTSYESNGPEVKLRGNAQQLHEKYMTLAHDAATSGERISAEAFTQFADHYFRLHQAAVGVAETKRQQEQANAAVDDAVSGESRRNQEPAAANDEVGLPAGENANQASAQPNGGDGVAESTDAASKKRRGPRNGAAKNGADTNGVAKNGAANNGADDRTNLSPAQLAEAVQGDQDSEQPS